MPEAQQQLFEELRCFQHHLRKENGQSQINGSGKIVLDFAYGSPSEARASSLRRTSIDKIRYLQMTNGKKRCGMKKNKAIPCIAELLRKSYARGRVMHICIGKILDESGATFRRGMPETNGVRGGATALDVVDCGSRERSWH